VNGERVIEHPLADGDVIRFGSVEMTFRLLQP
jgi:pSer/pThr/pTyr-binding forkhead associated (FHA) protein